ncbi:MAG: glutathione S-transferase family protein [Magnetospirillum sp.]|nr:glutathione S-transferase family protein [Magnetospirillum sp.]
MNHVLYERPGWGSAMIEAQLALYGIAHERVPVAHLYSDEAARDAFRKINPAGQVPALVLPDGTLMTESAAITLHLADAARSDALVPAPGAAERPAFLRWLVFLVVQVYAPFAIGDRPEKFVPGAEAAAALAGNVRRLREDMWRVAEAAAGAPWFLGERFSALDVFVCTMTHWTPRRPWFDANAPKLARIAARADALPELAAVWRRNFPNG